MTQYAPPADPWLHTLIESLTAPATSPMGDAIPAYPPEQLQRDTTGLSSEAALRQAHAFFEDVCDAAGRAGLVPGRDTRVLDFGAGWGRISRMFMRDVPLAGIHGIDVDPDFVALLDQSFGPGHFSVCTPFPPTALAAGSFDLIVAYSVFSHLSEAAARSWMQEFERLLRPGGVVAFTTRHESFFDYCAHAASLPEATGYRRALGGLFGDIEQARARYRAGEFVHGSSPGVDGGGPRDASFYGESWIPEQYARHGFGPGFEFVAGYFDPARYDQATFALRRVG
jgi:SAM-dependent methyltransferase